eukprot:gene12810-17173_t
MALQGVGYFVSSIGLQMVYCHRLHCTKTLKNVSLSIMRRIKFSTASGFNTETIKIKKKDEERKKSNLYTRTGDSGTSSLYNGERREKSELVFHALGHQDELNAVIGIAVEYCLISNNGLDKMLIEIQSRLFDLGAAVATPTTTSSTEDKKAYTLFSPKHTSRLEEWIDELDSDLPPLVNFIIPSGGLSATHLNLARTVCRRAERAVVPLMLDNVVDAEVCKYLNRLSDFLFAAMRTASKRENKPETIWKKSI